jgi:hypothetical protein
VDDLLHALDDLGLAVDAVLPSQAEHVGQVLASAILGPPRSDRPQSPLRWVAVQGTTPPDSEGPVKVEVRALYVKTSERADPVSRQALLVEAWRWDRSALHRFLLSLQSGRGDLRGAVVAGRRRHQSCKQGLDAPIDVVVDRAAGLLASPVVRRLVRERLVGAWPTSIRTGRPSWRTDGSGHGLLAKFLGQFSDLGLGVVAAVAAEGLQER